ncbi:helix-turn-helix domain-containing protein [Thiothrix nivea]|uniref:HigA2-like helix-turn-helix domain-containing protein n=1 Tax=Thiothrix nivea (strain ATCC 35100 / DSM 5205 / JP2) TaxID=870187 RepID=A0A656HDP1_THINJ|nr:XRE family transcriptional regulator [Thiothrix nivea]EIJ34527.1 hypothetical protein Thini_1951 [Thiothrix nivea DSM 5205]
MSVEHITPAGGNIFADLGFAPEEAANLLVRAQLMRELSSILKTRFSTQEEAATALDVSQARISDLYRGKIGRFTVDMLINLLSRVGRSVEVHIKAAA